MNAIHADLALDWLRQAYAATGGAGFSHSYVPLLGWCKGYPETTGYIIETLLRYADIRQDDSLKTLAEAAGDWLCSIQHLNGAYSGLLAGHPHPSAFNTAQILFGLTHTNRQEAALRARRWLLSIQEPDGSWQQAAYVPGFTPSYYTRAVWGVLFSLQKWPEETASASMRKAMRFYTNRFLPNSAVQDWGFYPGQPAFTHTIAYTLEGFLESALLLNETEILEKTVHSAKVLADQIIRDGRPAGRYDTDWRGDYTFQCLTGLAQCCVLFHRVYEVSGQARYRDLSAQLQAGLLPYQCLHGPPGIRGAMAGSAPVWGPYMRFRFPNWGVKFLLDALALNKHSFDSLASVVTSPPPTHYPPARYPPAAASDRSLFWQFYSSFPE